MSGAGSARKQKKAIFYKKLVGMFNEYNKIVIATADNVGGKQMNNIRKALRGKATLIMGKNTLIKKVIKELNNEQLDTIVSKVRGNVGLIFTNDDLAAIKTVLANELVAAPAKAGAIAPCNVVIPAMNTGMDPSATGFFQALNIATKINKGAIEIVADVNLLKIGQKVGASEANLLAKLDLKPFKYGMSITTVYDNGFLYDAALLDMTDDAILAKFKNGVKNVACASLALGQPNVASLPHMLINGFKNVLSVSLAADFKIKQTENLSAAAAPVAVAAPAEDKKETKKAEEKPKAPEPEEDEDMGFGLFD